MTDLMDYFQQQQIRDLQSELGEVSREAGRANLEARLLEETVDRLVLACQAMWDVLGKRGGLDDEELLEKIREIDLMDGTQDNRIRRPAKTCPSCKRRNGPRRCRCLYCGGAMEEIAFS